MGLNRLAAVYAVISRHFSASPPTLGFAHSSTPLPFSSPPFDSKQVDYKRACGLHRASSLPELSSSANKTDLEPGLHYYFVHPSTNNCPMVKYSPCFWWNQATMEWLLCSHCKYILYSRHDLTPCKDIAVGANGSNRNGIHLFGFGFQNFSTVNQHLKKAKLPRTQ